MCVCVCVCGIHASLYHTCGTWVMATTTCETNITIIINFYYYYCEVGDEMVVLSSPPH